MSVTKGDVINKFRSLNATYYVTRGAMVSTVPDEIAEKFIRDAPQGYVWRERYNSMVSDKVNIRTITVQVPVFGQWIDLDLDRPLKPEHRTEFEDYFEFGSHCARYSENRIVFRFATDIDTSKGSIQSIMLPDGASESDPVDLEYATQAFRLLILGGYVKYWAAASEFQTWFVDVAKIPPQIAQVKNNLAEYIFENMRPLPLPVAPNVTAE
jgi:hypothetical protein